MAINYANSRAYDLMDSDWSTLNTLMLRNKSLDERNS